MMVIFVNFICLFIHINEVKSSVGKVGLGHWRR